MIDDSEPERVDPRLVESKRQLALKIARHCRGKRLDQHLVHEVTQIYEDHRVAARQDGVDFPELVPLVLDEQRKINLVRRDLDQASIDNLVLEIAQDQLSNDRYSPGEIARAVRRAFPHHKR